MATRRRLDWGRTTDLLEKCNASLEDTYTIQCANDHEFYALLRSLHQAVYRKCRGQMSIYGDLDHHRICICKMNN